MNMTKSLAPDKNRIKVVSALEFLRTELIDLMFQVEKAHGTVKEPGFTALHDLFDKVWEGSCEYADRIAQRIGQLGEIPRETSEWMSSKNRSAQYFGAIVSGREQVAALASRLSLLGREIRISSLSAGASKDGETAFLFKEIGLAMEKYLRLAGTIRPDR